MFGNQKRIAEQEVLRNSISTLGLSVCYSANSTDILLTFKIAKSYRPLNL